MTGKPTTTQLNSLIDLERELHTSAVRSNPARLESLLHESFIECGRSGRIMTRDDILRELSDEVMDYDIVAQDFNVCLLSDDTVLVTYRSARRDQGGSLSRSTFRASIWQRTANGWLVRFHQGTPTPD